MLSQLRLQLTLRNVAVALLLLGLMLAAGPAQTATSTLPPPTLVSPPDGTHTTGDPDAPPGPGKFPPLGVPTLVWNPVAGATKYKLEVSTSPAFNPLTINRENLHYPRYTPTGEDVASGSGLTDNTLFYWRVSAWDPDANAWTAPSAVWSFTRHWTVKPVLSSPANGAILLFTPRFEWEPVLGTSRYELQISTSPTFDSPTIYYPRSPTYTPQNSLANDTDYYWRVRARDRRDNPGEWSNDGNGWQFRVRWSYWSVDGERRPRPLTPPNLTVIKGMPLFSWTPVAGAKKYEVELNTDPNFNPSYRIFHPEVANTAYTFTLDNWYKLCGNTTYYWRVRAKDANDHYGQWNSDPPSINFAFITPPGGPPDLTCQSGYAIPGATGPSLFYPPVYYDPSVNVGNFSDRTVPIGTFMWDHFPGSITYTLEVDDDPVFNPPLWTTTTQNLNVTLDAPFNPDQDYYWRVRAGAGAAPPRRAGQAMAYDSQRHRTTVFGGYYSSGITQYMNDTWEWNGSSWSQAIPPTPTPSARESLAMAYDSGRGVAVLFGGSNGTSNLGDTWEWNGSNWTQRSTSPTPTPRSDHALAYDSGRSVTVLFGGSGSAGNLGDTWEWNGSNWTHPTPDPAPAPRSGLALAYDSDRGVTVLFGGSGSSADCPPSGYCDDTWEWDGTTWTQAAPAISPPARKWHALAYDSQRHVTVLFGGFDGSGYLGDTWEWDGTNWTQRTPTTNPTARDQHSLVYDSQAQYTLLFGGASNSGYLSDIWSWNGTNWTPLTPGTYRDSDIWKTRINTALLGSGTITTTPQLLRPTYKKEPDDRTYGWESVEYWPSFEWQPVNGAAQYRIQIAQYSDMTGLVEDHITRLPNYTPLTRYPWGTYYWRVQALDSGGVAIGDWSSIYRLVISSQIQTGPISDNSTNDFPASSLLASDPAGDAPAGGFDLSQLYTALSRDGSGTDAWYLGLHTAPITAPVRYGIYLDTNRAECIDAPPSCDGGATTDPLGMNLSVTPPHRPEYAIYWDLNGGLVTEAALYTWASGAWGPGIPLGKAFYNADTGFIKLEIPFTAIGNPSSISFMAFSADPITGQPAQDTVPSNADNTDLVSFVTDTQAPTPVLPPANPIDPSANVPAVSAPVYMWHMLDGMWTSRIQVALDYGFSTIYKSQQGWTPNTMAYDELNPYYAAEPAYADNSTYYWRMAVVYYDPLDPRISVLGQYGEPSQFSKFAKVPVNLQVSPLTISGTITYTWRTPAFQWDPAEGAAQYRIKVYASGNPNPVLSMETAQTSYIWTETLDDGAYNWTLEAKDTDGSYSTNLAAGWFTKVYSAVVPLYPLTPTAQLDPLEFRWEPIGPGMNYELHTASDPYFSRNLNTYTTYSTIFTPEGVPSALTTGGDLYWRVRLKDGSGHVGPWAQLYIPAGGPYRIYLPIAIR